jgi:hypothetical protein
MADETALGRGMLQEEERGAVWRGGLLAEDDVWV